jgi:hypothetical protein
MQFSKGAHMVAPGERLYSLGAFLSFILFNGLTIQN